MLNGLPLKCALLPSHYPQSRAPPASHFLSHITSAPCANLTTTFPFLLAAPTIPVCTSDLHFSVPILATLSAFIIPVLASIRSFCATSNAWLWISLSSCLLSLSACTVGDRLGCFGGAFSTVEASDCSVSAGLNH